MNSKIIKNASWLFSGQAIGRALRAILIVFAARTLGTSEWGVFSYALSLAAAFTVFSDIGINALLVREGSRDSSLRSKYLSTGLAIKLILLSGISIFALLAKDIIVRIPEAAILIPLIIAIFVIDSLRDFVSALARSFERMDIEAKGQIITNMGIVGFGLLFLYLNPTSASLASGYVVGTLLGLIAVFVPLRSYFRGLVKEFSRGLIKEIIVSAWPFGLVSLMGVIMINTDILVLGSVGSASDVGLYAAAQKPVQLLYLIPSILAAAFFPTLSREAGENAKFRDTLEKGLKSAYFFAIPMALGGALAAEPVMRLVYGPDFISSAPSFIFLSLTFLFVFPSVFFTNALFAKNSQRSFYGLLLIGVLVNVFLDIILIPCFGITGCAIATLIVQAVLFTYGAVKLGRVSLFSIVPSGGRLIIASLFMGAVVIGLLYLSVPVLLVVGLGFVSYILALIALKEPVFKEVYNAIRRKPGLTSGVEM